MTELLEYLGFDIETNDIERANRVGGGQDKEQNGPRAIVMELVSERLKHAILAEAAVKLRQGSKSKLSTLVNFKVNTLGAPFFAPPFCRGP